MNRHVNAIAGRLSLRPPQRQSLEILDRITEIVPPRKGNDPGEALAAIRSEFPTVTDFEREFPSLCFALATGVGKTRPNREDGKGKADRASHKRWPATMELLESGDTLLISGDLKSVLCPPITPRSSSYEIVGSSTRSSIAARSSCPSRGAAAFVIRNSHD